MKARLIKWQQLTEAQRAEVRRAFVYWHYDKTVKTFEEWAQQKAFYINGKGNLAARPNHCEPAFMAD